MAVSPLTAGTVPLAQPAVVGTAPGDLIALHASAAACDGHPMANHGCRGCVSQLVLPLELKQDSSFSGCMLTCRLDYEGLCVWLRRQRMGKTFVPTGSDNVAITGIPTLFMGRQPDARYRCLLTALCCSSEAITCCNCPAWCKCCMAPSVWLPAWEDLSSSACALQTGAIRSGGRIHHHPQIQVIGGSGKHYC